ncbi:MAG: PSD1 and planctomycete cytochrome C domain-containing protein [Acidobacteria bacterium]|nr:PSD1 and planctomycete cytochrome C domain-containing protein [Acidobacteriota bacterium]
MSTKRCPHSFGQQNILIGIVLQVVILGVLRAENFAFGPRVDSNNGGHPGEELGATRLFAEQIRPMLEANCITCHNSSKKTSGLDLTTREALLRGGDRGPAIVLGNAKASQFYKAVTHTGEVQMPPGQKLSEAVIAYIADWINAGASYDRDASVSMASAHKATDTQSATKPDNNSIFGQQIRPVLEANCIKCHNSGKKTAGLDLSTREGLLRGGDRGPAIVPANAKASLLYKAVTHTGEVQMPYQGDKLPEAVIAYIEDWINAGAAYDQPLQVSSSEPVKGKTLNHWAFNVPSRPPVPAVRNRRWVRNPIDAFVAAKHEKLGLKPSQAAKKTVLLRRVHLDLVGLPPTPAEVQAFLEDTSKEAYEKVVDRLLSSPHYGERWGRHWMDIWRYSDWYGFKSQVRNSQKHIWRWRDWIIESLNANKGYDRMIVEMLAGDEVSPTDPETLRATGYLARSWYKFNRNEWLKDVVDHTSTAFLGVSLRCARCHAHKYDPFSQEEYYKFRAFFEPYEVRIDRVLGQPDLEKDGLTRVFDKDLKAQTFRFISGNEQKPDKENSLSPGTPAVLGGSRIDIHPISLPLESYYPDFRSFVHQDLIREAEDRIKKAESDLARIQKTLTSLKRGAPPVPTKQDTDTLALDQTPKDTALAVGTGKVGKVEHLTIEQAQIGVDLSKKMLENARANLVGLKARIAADKARFAVPPDPEAEALAGEAKRAELWVNLSKAEEGLLRAQQKLIDARRALESGNKKKEGENPLTASPAQMNFAAAVQQLKTAQVALGEAKDYTPVGMIYPTVSSGRRLALASWIANKQNPLTARVAVNHIWLRLFGEALVPSATDFGRNGQVPPLRELLDWLALEFMEKNWNMKAIQRLILTSSTYRMQSSIDGSSKSNLAVDRENRYLWRMNPRRMEAEIIRDSLLYVAGQLDTTVIGGPEIDESKGQTCRRRSIYLRHAPGHQMEFLKLFNVADPVECYRRTESITPQQALAMANSELSLTLSRVLTRQFSQGSKRATDASSFVNEAFQRILGQAPSSKERAICETFLLKQAEFLSKATSSKSNTTDKTSFGDDERPDSTNVRASSNALLRARENLVHVLMNHNEFVTIR